ncbi:hypothetical protein JCM10207_005004 [Rhodosporidiobolus poonsookiae]
MNHLYHSLSPLVLLAAFLVSLLSFLAPTPILSDQVSLLSLSTNVSSSTNTTTAKRWIAADSHAAVAHSKRMVKRAKKASLAAATTTQVDLVLGPLGACYSNSTSSDPVCLSPSFTPIFVELYDTVGLSNTVQSALPEQFPLAPSALFLSIALLAVEFIAVVLSSLGMHATKRLRFFTAKQPLLRKAATVAGIAAFVIGIAATAALRVQLGKVVDKLKEASVEGKLGTGFHLLYAGIVLEAVALLLLGAEAITSR